MTEEWRDINGFEGIYQVSSNGIIRSLDRILPSGRWGHVSRKGGIIKPKLTKQGYLEVGLRINGIRKWLRVHRLVCEAFNGPAPKGKSYVAHFPDMTTTNNTLANLMWASPLENSRHREVHGTLPIGEKNPSSVLNENDVLYIRENYVRGKPRNPGNQGELAKMFGVCHATIKSVANRKTWSTE